MEDGRWKMEDGRWKMEDGRWKMEVEMGLAWQFLVLGLWEIGGGRWDLLFFVDVAFSVG